MQKYVKKQTYEERNMHCVDYFKKKKIKRRLYILIYIFVYFFYNAQLPILHHPLCGLAKQEHIKLSLGTNFLLNNLYQWSLQQEGTKLIVALH